MENNGINATHNMKGIIMKKIILISITLFLYSFDIAPIFAIRNTEYKQWIIGKFDISPEIKKVTNVSNLKPFLDDKREFTRMVAVRRLGEIEGPNSVGLLIKIFETEPLTVKGLESYPLVKLEVIRTLGRIGTEQAKSALLGMLKNLWEKGPVLPKGKKNKGYFYFDRDFAPVVPALLEALYQWSNDKDVSEIAKIIAFSEDIKKYPGYRIRDGIGHKAWQIYIKAQMFEKGVIEEKESAEYLIAYEENITKKDLTTLPLGTLRRSASRAVLSKLNTATLRSLLTEAQQEYEKNRNVECRRRIEIINKVLEEKDEKLNKGINKDKDSIPSKDNDN